MKLIQLFEHVSRVQSIDLHEALSIIKTECGNTISKINNIPIYRGADFKNSNFFVGSSAAGTDRKSANTQNYYTLIVDNDPRWKEYPKRGKSFICSTASYIADAYGVIGLVIPFDNANVGICPEEDYWLSFKTSFMDLQIADAFEGLDTLNDFANMLLQAHDLSSANVQTISELKAIFSKITFDSTQKIINNSDDKYVKKQAENYSDQIEKLKKFDSLYDMYYEVLSPTKNKFKQSKASSIKNLGNETEIFIEGKCLFLTNNFYNDLNDEDQNTVDIAFKRYPTILDWIKN